jgi:hypothetical protein
MTEEEKNTQQLFYSMIDTKKTIEALARLREGFESIGRAASGIDTSLAERNTAVPKKVLKKKPIRQPDGTIELLPKRKAQDALGNTRETHRKVHKKPGSSGAPARTPAPEAVATEVEPREKRKTYERNFNEHGFVVGTMADIISTELVKGGESRQDIQDRIKAQISGATRSGNPVNISSAVSGQLLKMIDRGYRIEQWYRVVPPVDMPASNGLSKP